MGAGRLRRPSPKVALVAVCDSFDSLAERGSAVHSMGYKDLVEKVMASKHEEYLAAREKWVHEDLLINHRLTWLLASQTLLFAAYGVVLGIEAKGILFQKIPKIINTISFLGFGTAVLLLFSIASACLALHHLRTASEFQLVVTNGTHWGGLIAPICLPISFMVAWAYLSGWLFC